MSQLPHFPLVILTTQQETSQQSTNQPETNNEKSLDNIGWEDLTIQDNDVMVLGKCLSSYLSREIHTICSNLKMRGIKNCAKAVMIERVKDTYTNHQKYKNTLVEVQGASTTAAAKPRKEPQCSYRLLNIIFSDEFAEKFACLGDVASCGLLDQGKAGNDQCFWQEIQEAFVNDTKYYKRILSKSKILLVLYSCE